MEIVEILKPKRNPLKQKFSSKKIILSDILTTLGKLGATCATAESCTGGLIAAALTELPGSSAIFRGGIVAYQVDLKESQLDVSSDFIAKHGAVHPKVAESMATGVRKLYNATYAVATTGFAGPSGGTADSPVGTVIFGLAGPHGVRAIKLFFTGNRRTIRLAATDKALHLLAEMIKKHG
ncbi:MAG: CinA family protein [Proteobacteria bacterium]|nr:CinA family protein [Pseudomonadota bacterium]